MKGIERKIAQRTKKACKRYEKGNGGVRIYARVPPHTQAQMSRTSGICGREGIGASEDTKLFQFPPCSGTVDAVLNADLNIAKKTIIKTLSVSSLV
jgi:hypothetical protein